MQERCTISLVIVPLLVVLLLAGGYVPAIWLTLDHSARLSIEDVAETLQNMIVNDLESRCGAILDKMALVVRLWASTDFENDFHPTQLIRFSYIALEKTTELTFLTVARADGHVIGAMRIPSGDIVSGERLPTPENVTANISYWIPDGEKKIPYSNYVYDARQRPWYKTAVAAKDATFDQPYLSASDNERLLPFSIPVYSKKTPGVLIAVLSSSCQLSRFANNIHAMHDILRGSGLIAILDMSDLGSVIASSSGRPSSLTEDIHETISKVQSLGLAEGQLNITSQKFHSFGDSYFAQYQLQFAAYTGPTVLDLNWRLVVVLPKSEYFDFIQQYNDIVGGAYTTVYVVILVVVTCVVSYFVIIRPINQIAKELREQGINGTAAAMGGRRSFFLREIARFYGATAETTTIPSTSRSTQRNVSTAATTRPSEPIASATAAPDGKP